MTLEREGQYYYANGANVFQVKDAPGVLKRITVGTAAAGTITVYDSASANSNEMFQIPAATTGTFEIQAAMRYGIRVVQAAASKSAVIYE